MIIDCVAPIKIFNENQTFTFISMKENDQNTSDIIMYTNVKTLIAKFVYRSQIIKIMHHEIVTPYNDVSMQIK